MKILAIETSCDETAAAIIEGKPKDKKVKILSNVISSSLKLHAKTGGIIPEVAAREQIKYLIPIIEEAFKKAKIKTSKDNIPDIDQIAVTIGPGLIGSLLIGVETAKTLSLLWKKPIIPVNHLYGHIYANFVKQDAIKKDITFPAIVLVVSGGHTDLLLMRNHNNIKWLGGTRDDAAGEAFDKIGRLLNLPYPGGPNIEEAASKGDEKKYNFPRPLIGSLDFDFSFSGLKTAVLREVKTIVKIDNKQVADLSASLQKAIIDVLIRKTIKAVKEYSVKSILISGGVSANKKLENQFLKEIKDNKINIDFFVPEKWLCTDNASMIGACAFFRGKPIPLEKITANPELYFN
ncbi:MAG TPA: tRNA (adenosine(37)-N6)-threonylcarbamoyltransferase complex transferase subunit TsaD [Patescibacteria group bacterium]|nr:tRNA (adenosine(37)-N6)-threonylcarbamoyltransferase complex transferase subunit TsaD [Patescibacteria group bacterium]